MHKVINIKLLTLIIVILIGAFLRFYKIEEFPVQLNNDEISQLYDLKSVIATGKDIYGNSYPLAFPSTGDYKPGHYIYISIIPYLLFGDDEVTIRVAAAFFGSFTILTVFLFVKILTKNWWLAIISAFLVSFTPSEIFYSRKSFENVIGVSLAFFGLYFLIKSFGLKKFNIFGYMGILLLTLAMYVYTSHIITVPLILLSTFFIYKKELSFNKKIFPWIFFWLVIIAPLIYVTMTNPDLRFRASSVFLTQDPNLGELISVTNSPLTSYFHHTVVKYLNQFNFSYLFGSGLFLTNQGMIGSGPLMIIQLPLVMLGIAYLFSQSRFQRVGKILIGLVMIGMIPSALTFEDFSPHRSVFAFTNLSIISAFGLYWLIKLLYQSNLSSLIKKGAYTFIFLMILLNFLYFIRIYIFAYPYEKSQFIQYPFKIISQYIWSQYDSYETIIFDPKFGITEPMVGVGAQYYLAYYGNLLPKDVQMMNLDLNSEKMVMNKIIIRQIYWPYDKDLKNTLIIGSKWTIPIEQVNKNKIIHTFHFYDGQEAFYAIKL